MNAVEVRDLVKRYRGGRDKAVDGVTFDVADGTLFCLLGPNGAGKTTTVSILTTTLTATSGRVRIAGLDLGENVAAVRRRIGVVFQQPSLDLNLTAEENIRLHAVLYGLFPWRPAYRLMSRRYRDRVDELASVLGVAGQLGQPVRTLSGGTQRKLEIVRALMHRPRVVFLDEPTTGLDPESRRSLWRYLRAGRAADGTTLFLTTHYLEEAEGADTICVLHHGRVIEQGSPSELKARHGRPELLLDADDRARLRGRLAAVGIRVNGDGPLRVSLDGRDAAGVARALGCALTQLQVSQPTLEDIYLTLLSRTGA